MRSARDSYRIIFEENKEKSKNDNVFFVDFTRKVASFIRFTSFMRIG